jgi:hypothetical protein
MLRRRRLFIGGISAMVLAGGAVAVTTGSTGSAVASRSGFVALHEAALTSSLRTASHGPMSPVLSSDFAVFGRSTNGQPPLPGIVLGRWDRVSSVGINSSYGLDPTRAQYVPIAGGRDVWLVPGTAGACMVVARYAPDLNRSLYSTICDSDAGLASGKFWTLEMGPGQSQTIIGFVPNTNKAVTLTTGSGATVQAPVTNNLYTATSDTGFRSFQSRNSSGDVVGAQ